MLMIHKPKGEIHNLTTSRSSGESRFHWKNHFHKKPLSSRINADFEAGNESDNSSIGFKTTNIYKQNPVCNGYYAISGLNDVFQSGYFRYPLSYDNVSWFVNEVIKWRKNWLSSSNTLRNISF